YFCASHEATWVWSCPCCLPCNIACLDSSRSMQPQRRQSAKAPQRRHPRCSRSSWCHSPLCPGRHSFHRHLSLQASCGDLCTLEMVSSSPVDEKKIDLVMQLKIIFLHSHFTKPIS